MFMSDTSFQVATLQGNGTNPRDIMLVQYIGPDLRGTPSPSGLHLPAPTAIVSPTSTKITYFDSHWNKPTDPAAAGYVNPGAAWVDPFSGTNRTQSENPANYVGWTTFDVKILNAMKGDEESMYSSASKTRYRMETKGFSWQAYLWDGTIVPTYGYREDTNKINSASAPITSVLEGVRDVHAPSYVFASTPDDVLKTKIHTWSLVVHTPRFLRERLPFGSNVSLLYSQSSNFDPADVGRVGINKDGLATPMDPSEGESKDYGVAISTLNNRLHFKVTKYETVVKNASYSFTGLGKMAEQESHMWVAANRYKVGLTGDPLYSGSDYNFGHTEGGTFVQSPQERALQQAAVDAYFAAVPLNFLATYKIDVNNDEKWKGGHWSLEGGTYGITPPGLTATRDIASKGWEYELVANLMRNWTIAINAAKTDAITTNSVGNLAEWIESRREFLRTSPAREIRIFSGLGDPMWLRYDNEMGNDYLFEKYTDGASVQELRPWRFNVVTNYRFDRGRFKGLSVGGAYRWEDDVVIGYPWIRGTINNVPTDIPDVAHPYIGPSNDNLDLWFGYERKLRDKIRWRLQLNVRNVFGKNELVPVSVEPDNSVGLYRIKTRPTWWITNSFFF